MKDPQVKILLNHLFAGMAIDRVQAFKFYGIADLRSRICDVERQFNVNIDRRTKPGCRYKEYFIKQNPLGI